MLLAALYSVTRRESERDVADGFNCVVVVDVVEALEVISRKIFAMYLFMYSST